MQRSGEKSFEDCIDIIDLAVRKQKSKWRLDAIAWFDYEDVEQIIKSHINKKWLLWDQARPLEPWLNTIITNQIRNLIRNHYGNYVKPCATCVFNMGDNSCSATASGVQNSQCIDYKKWEDSKKAAFDLKMPVSAENHYYELSSRTQQTFCFETSLEKLNYYMKEELSPLHYQAYQMLFFGDASEEEVAALMGYKTTEKKRKAGYRQIKNLKKLFHQKASLIIKKYDIINDEIN
jgi:hypothetical protein